MHRAWQIFRRCLALGSLAKLKAELEREGQRGNVRNNAEGERSGGKRVSWGALCEQLRNRTCLGEMVNNGTPYPGEHEAFLKRAPWDQVQKRHQATCTRNVEGRHATKGKEP